MPAGFLRYNDIIWVIIYNDNIWVIIYNDNIGGHIMIIFGDNKKIRKKIRNTDISSNTCPKPENSKF